MVSFQSPSWLGILFSQNLAVLDHLSHGKILCIAQNIICQVKIWRKFTIKNTFHSSIRMCCSCGTNSCVKCRIQEGVCDIDYITFCKQHLARSSANKHLQDSTSSNLNVLVLKMNSTLKVLILYGKLLLVAEFFFQNGER